MTVDEMCERCMVLKGLDYRAGTFAAAAIANAIAEGLTVEETAALGLFLSTISIAVAYVAAQKTLNNYSGVGEIV